MHNQALTTHCDTCWVGGQPARGLVAQVEGGQQRLPGGSYAYKLSLERKVSYARDFPVPCGENWALRWGWEQARKLLVATALGAGTRDCPRRNLRVGEHYGIWGEAELPNRV